MGITTYGGSELQGAKSELVRTSRLYLTVDAALEKRFREEVARRLGMKKGNLQAAIEEAIVLWLKNKG
jgi:hypothetical protein